MSERNALADGLFDAAGTIQSASRVLGKSARDTYTLWLMELNRTSN